MPPTLESNPLWYKDAIIYEIHIRAFADSNGDGIGDFPGLIEKLDYLQDLGITAIWILPFYPSPLRDGGYDISDYTDINPCYGTIDDFKRLLDEAHRRGIRVITELVINHTSNEHAWFQRARRAPPGSPERDFYVWSDTPKRYEDARIIFKDFETSNWAWDPVANAYYWHRFYSHQPDLNFDNPAVHEAILQAVDFWLEMGVDGLRLDAVPYLYEREGTICENLRETHEYLRDLRAYIDGKYADRMLLAEANQWPEDASAYFGKGDECHMNFHFPLMPRMFMAVELEDSFPLMNILKQTPTIPANCQWATFLRNHDELTLEMVTDEDRDYMYRVYAEESRARINLGIRRRLSPLMRLRRRTELMNALLFSLPGTPVLYYGDEIGMGDNIYLGDRDGVRTPMQWSGDRNAGFSRCNPQKLYLPVIVDPEYHYEAINVEAQQSNPSSLLWWSKRLINLRKQNPVLGRGDIEFLQPDNGRVLAFLRCIDDQRVLVVANLSRYAQFVELDLSRFKGAVPVELFGSTRFPEIGDATYRLTLGPYDFFWFALEATTAMGQEEGDVLPSLAVQGAWTSVLEGASRTALTKLLSQYLPARRWFRSKARTRKLTSIVDVVPFPSEGEGSSASPFFMLLVRVEFADGVPETYVLPVGFATGERAKNLVSRSRHAVITAIDVRDPGPGMETEGVLYDALLSPEFAERLLAMIQGKQVLSASRGKLVGIPFATLPDLDPEVSLKVRVSETEQTNTTLFFEDRLMLKVFRMVEEGISPDLEIGRFLTARGFTGTPRIAGAIELRDGREPAAVAMLQEYMPNQGDVWTVTMESVDRFFERVLASEEARGMKPPTPEGSLIESANAEPPQFVVDMMGTYLQRAALLGRRTAELHLALGADTNDPNFSREPFTAMHQRSLYQYAHSMLARNFAALRRRENSLPEPIREMAASLALREAEVDAQLADVFGRRVIVDRIRSHGDYHLGQVLYTGDDFVIIDFEGEPARPLSERRYKRCPLRDVAGMLRSFHYVGASALRRGRVRPEDVPALTPWVDAWVAWTSAAFLNGYLPTIRAGNELLIPRTAADTELLLGFYLLEKCIYEVGYELNNRPDWLEIPLQGLAQILSERSPV
ncbi:maltose alpha-D-glucosyltransferase [Chondromyces crocatus]|uniref:Maltokinase n=1 Tax=Chondromyces crocatus TaxID=52 RepID=A0A0K1E9A4_CHOCO|nr:maltose alpha-D-glucosyltransferase [Chondromyces crocatus]AKT37257.1 alpha-amylase [Chondromyces crocatus]